VSVGGLQAHDESSSLPERTASVTYPEFAPLKVALVWLAGTYVLFLVVGEVGLVPDLYKLTAYVASTLACLIGGYRLKIAQLRGREPSEALPIEQDDVRGIRLMLVLSALYYLAYGLAYMSEYGVASLQAVLAAISDPGSAYLAKFDVYENQVAGASSNPVVQVITLAAVLSAPLVPFLIIYWRRLTLDVKLFALLSLLVYCAFFIAIGTLVGLGNILIFTAVSVLVVRARTVRSASSRRRRGAVAIALIAGVAFAGYMSYNQSQRLEATGISQRFEPNPLVRSITGDQFARGVSVTAFYPTHGYVGLSYNLDTPFEWTRGRGASRALDSYLAQYGIADTVAQGTYPVRTEARTGWPAGQYWSTIYPWLASDLTLPGAALFMAVVGWWNETVVHGSRLSLLLFAQAMVLISYVPANNQLGLSRPNLICAVSLLALYVVRRGRRAPARPTDSLNHPVASPRANRR
jgi:hypothetical protein